MKKRSKFWLMIAIFLISYLLVSTISAFGTSYFHQEIQIDFGEILMGDETKDETK